MRSSFTASTITLFLIVLVLGLSTPVDAKYVAGQQGARPEILPGRFIVQFTDDIDRGRMARAFGRVSVGEPSVDELLAQLEVDEVRPLFPEAGPRLSSDVVAKFSRYYELTMPETADPASVVAGLMQNPHVVMAEPVFLYYVDATPNDPQFGAQYHVAPPGPDAEVYNAWDLERGSDSIKIAIIDSGVLYAHADLAANVWVNPGEDLDGDGEVFDLDDMNGIDDDGNSFIDDVIGWDFVSSSQNPAAGEDGSVRDNDPKDYNGHGTHVSGIAAAVTNNSTNGAGVAGGWAGGHRSNRGCRIMCLRAGYLNTAGNGVLNSGDCAAAVYYAWANGAHVINASFGGGSYSQAMADAMSAAINAGVAFIHSAGNDNSNVEGWHDMVPGVVTVASTTSSDTKSSFSNYGPWVSVSAPGSNILSTYSNFYAPTMAYLDGTSMSSPFVTGLHALIRSMMPSLTRQQVDSIIIATTDNIDAKNPAYAGQLGTGRVNAFKALQALANAKFTSNVTDANVPFTVNFTDVSPNSPTAWDWNFGDGATSTLQNPSHDYTVPGLYDVSLKVTEARGLGEEHLKRYIWARADTLKVDSLLVLPGSQVVMKVKLTNTALIKETTFPFTLYNEQGIHLDSFSVIGTRAELYSQVSYERYDSTSQMFAIRMVPSAVGTSQYTPPDTGLYLKLYIEIPAEAARGTVVVLDTVSQGFGGNIKPKIRTTVGDYWPVFKAGKIVVQPCVRGKVLCGPPPINLVDLSTLIGYLTTGGPQLDPYGGNVNGAGIIDLADLSYLIAYLVGVGPQPPE